MKILMEKQYSLTDMVTAFNSWAGWSPHDYRKYLYQESFGYFIKDVLDCINSTNYGSGLKSRNIQFADYDSDNDEYDLKDYVAQMLDEFYLRYCDYFAAADSSVTDVPEEQTMLDFYAKLFNVLNVTYPKYATIIKFYKNNETKLMDSLNRDYTDDADSSGTVTSRYNDTPQDGGLFEDDTHTSNVNETSSSSDSGLEHKETYNNEYMIDRINKIRDNLSNLFTEWENKVATILWR